MANPTPINLGPAGNGGSSTPNPPTGGSGGAQPPAQSGGGIDVPLYALWALVILSAIGLGLGLLIDGIWVAMAFVLSVVVLVVAGIIAVAFVAGSGLADKAGAFGEGAKLQFPTGAFVKSILKKYIGLRPADQTWIYLNELTADKASSKGWYTQGLDGGMLGRLAIGFPFIRVPYASVDRSSEQFTWSITSNPPGGEAYEVEVVVDAQVIQENGTVTLETARRLLTEVDKDPELVIQSNFGSIYQQAIKDAGVTGSVDHSAKFADIDEAALERANVALEKFGLRVTDVRTQKVKPGAAAETGAETRAVVDAVTSGLVQSGTQLMEQVPAEQRGLVAGAMLVGQGLLSAFSMGIQKLPDVLKAWDGKGGGNSRPAPEPKSDDDKKDKKKGKSRK